MASTDSEDPVIQRNRRTLYLIMAGAASLLIPLLGVLYIRMGDTPATMTPGNIPHAFARRATQADRIKAASTPAPPVSMVPVAGPAATARAPGTQAAPSASGGDSLGFIKGGAEYFPSEEPRPAAAPAQAETAPPAAKTEEADAATKKKPAKPGPKPFVQPKLQATGSGGTFRNLRGNKQLSPGAPNPAQGAMPPGGIPDVGSILQGIPGLSGDQKKK